MGWQDDEVVTAPTAQADWQQDEIVQQSVPDPSMLDVAGNAAWKGIAGTGDFLLNVAGAAGEGLIPYHLRPKAMKDPLRTGLETVGAIRPENEPQTAGQRILDRAVQAGVATAINPTSTVSGLVKNAVIGTVSGLAGGVTKEATGSELAATAAAVATPLLIHGAASLGAKANAPTLANPTKTATLKDAQAAGYVVPPSQVKPSFSANRLESVAGKAVIKQAAAEKNQLVTQQLAAKTLGLPTTEPLTPSAVLQVRQEANKIYEQVANLSPRAAVALDKLKEARLDVSDGWKEYALTRRADARRAAAAAETRVTQYEKLIAHEAQQAGQPGLVKQLRDARVLIAKTHTIEDAMNMGNGNVDAQYIGRLLDQRKPLSKELQIVGRFANAFRESAREGVTSSGVSGTDAAAGAMLGTIGYGAAGGPAGVIAGGLPLLRSPARSALLSGMYQKRLLAEPPELNQALLRSILAGRATAEAQ